MCCIGGIVPREPFLTRTTLERPRRLEYRNYDSFGFWNARQLVRRSYRPLLTFRESTRCAIAHTQWATHGGDRQRSTVNVPRSTIELLCDLCLRTTAGEEIAVALTQAYTNQALALFALAQGGVKGLGDLLQLLAKTSVLEQEVLEQEVLEPEITRIAATSPPVSQVAPLRHREARRISRRAGDRTQYQGGELSPRQGRMCGELKHSTLALIEESMPIVALLFGDDPKMRSNSQEVFARPSVIVPGTIADAEISISAAGGDEHAQSDEKSEL